MSKNHQPPRSKTPESPIDPAVARERLATSHGRTYWRSLDELTTTDPIGRMLQKEYSPEPTALDPVDRRSFLKVMSASMALGGLTACTRQPLEKIVPYVKPPEEAIPGKPLFFATAYTLGGYGCGVLAESHLGRPTKIEGNPNHPASLGSTDSFGQASVLGLYDPDRSNTPRLKGRPSTWPRFLAELEGLLADQSSTQGAGVRLLTETVTSPTLFSQIEAAREAYPKMEWHQYEPVNRDNARRGAEMAFGRVVDTVYDFTRADIVVCLDADVLLSVPAFARYARDAATRRDPDNEKGMSRIYVVEPSPSVTGLAADHRAPMRAGDVEAFARAVARGVGVTVEGEDAVEGAEDLLKAIVEDLQAHRGKSIVVAGDSQPPVVHALAYAINKTLENTNETVTYIEPVEPEPVIQVESIRALTEAMNAGEVDLLIMIGANPVHTAPADLGFSQGLEKVAHRVHFGLYFDETARLCHWHIPETHYLEAWGDVRAFDGTVSIVQPLIEPIYGGKSPLELLGALSGGSGKRGYDILREHWKGQGLLTDDEKAWRKALHEGTVPNSASAKTRTTLRSEFSAPSSAGEEIEVLFRPDASAYDGRFINNGWLQELPRPVTSLTWDNAALMSAATAKKLNVKQKYEEAGRVRLSRNGTELELPVLIVPGHAANSITVTLGYGREHAGSVAKGDDSPVGVDVYPLRTSAAPDRAADIDVKKAKGKHFLAITQLHPTVEQSAGVKGRHVMRVGALDAYQAHPEHPDFVHDGVHHADPALTLYKKQHEYGTGNSWAMAIDLSKCIGCNACTIACQAENNIPVVGKKEVLNARELHWIRIDKYYSGDEADPAIHTQPVPCMHCEDAPCETVCPVGATVHNSEGLNQMVYNRCVGTRYCSNNCPYKVRRFNFYKFADHESDAQKAVRNPDVTVRSRGVMEKCTYCVQRINSARIEAKREGNRPIRDGEVLTACQQACPTQAIRFGNINDPDSEINKARHSGLNYGLLEELNTKPRTTYHAKVHNPNALLGLKGGHHGGNGRQGADSKNEGHHG